MKQLLIASLVALALAGCDYLTGESNRRERVLRNKENWEKPCSDEAILLATTAGSPNEARCSNREHRMRIQVVTTQANEEIGSIAFCECQRIGKDGGP
jgi:hypothetical protein